MAEINEAYWNLVDQFPKGSDVSSFLIPENLRKFFEENKAAEKSFSKWSEKNKREFCEAFGTECEWESSQTAEKYEETKRRFLNYSEEHNLGNDSPGKLTEIKKNDNLKKRIFLTIGGTFLVAILTLLILKKIKINKFLKKQKNRF